MTNLEELILAGHGSPREPAGSSDGLRHQILDELRRGHEELEQDIAAKSDLLRNHKAPTNGVQAAARGSSNYYVYDKPRMQNASGSGSSTHSDRELESKLAEMTRAYNESLSNQRSTQAQMSQLVTQIRDLQSDLDQTELKYDQLAAAYQCLIQEAGVDEGMIQNLQATLEKYKNQADKHMESWRSSTMELEKQTASLRNSVGRGRGASINGEIGAMGSPTRSALSMH